MSSRRLGKQQLHLLSESETRCYNEIRAMIDEWSRLGETPYPDGTRWIGHVPHVAPLAHLHHLFSPLEPEAIEDLEHQLGLSLPRSFKGFLQLHNGMSVFSGYLNIYGLRRSWARTNIVESAQQPYSILTYNIKTRPPKSPDDALFVGSLGDKRDLAGLFSDGRIGIFERDTGAALDRSYPDLFGFILDEVKRTRVLFDDHGRRYDKSDLL